MGFMFSDPIFKMWCHKLHVIAKQMKISFSHMNILSVSLFWLFTHTLHYSYSYSGFGFPHWEKELKLIYIWLPSACSGITLQVNSIKNFYLSNQELKEFIWKKGSILYLSWPDKQFLPENKVRDILNSYVRWHRNLRHMRLTKSSTEVFMD